MTTSKEERKRAIDAYKDRKPRQGVFAVRCASTGHVWVGASPHLDAARNGLWFMLRTGSYRDASLQLEWRAHGEPGFRFEVLEELEADVSPLLVRDLLREKKAHWVGREKGRVLLP